MLESTRPKDELARLAACVTVLCEAVGRTPTKTTYLAYELGLEGLPVSNIEAATMLALRRPDHWMPSPGELRELAGVPRPADRAALAFQAVKQACSEVGAYRSPEFDDPVITATVANLGGWIRACALPVSEFDTWYRKDFLATYEMFCRTGVSQAAHLAGEHERANQLLGYETEPTKVATGLPWAHKAARLEGPR